jgi:uncharacterized damage-inducible protein DinB
MADVKTLLDLYRHMEWADATVWTAILACPVKSEDEKLRASLYHLHIAQQGFLRIWRSESLEAAFPQFATMKPLMSWARQYYADLFRFAQSWDDEKLSAPMPMPWAEHVVKKLGRSPEITTIGETALQVVLHSQYHRGQINAALRSISAEPPLVDYIAWVWLGRPPAVWPVGDPVSGD